MVDINGLIAKMTLRQKIAQMTQLTPEFFLADEEGVITGPMMADFGISDEDLVSIGSVLGSYDGEILYKIQKQHMAADPLQIPLIFMGDVIHGLKTIFPIPLALGSTWNPATVELAASISAIESSEAGLHVTFSPMADLVRDSRWGRVMESTGEDPYLNGEMSKAFIRGYQGENEELKKNRYKIAACLKHFAGYGAAEAGRDYAKAEISEHSLREYYLPAYKEAIQAGVKLVMTSFNTINDIPATGNKHLMIDILREEFEFEGVLISDWGAVTEMIHHGIAANHKDAAKLAMDSHLDMEMMTPAYLLGLEELLKDGAVELAQIDEAVFSILKLKDDLGLFDDPYRGYEAQLESNYEIKTLSGAHRDVARTIAEESFVLLKNDGKILPLESHDTQIILAGPIAQSQDIIGAWEAGGETKDAVSVADALRDVYPSLQVVHDMEIEGFVAHLEHKTDNGEVDAKKTDANVRQQTNSTKDKEVIILALGEHSGESGEAASRAHIKLPADQINLVDKAATTDKPIVVLIFSGRPLDLTDIVDKADAILQVWMPGTEGGNAIANIICGKSSPSGKLTMSFPRSVGQLPLYYNTFRTGRPWSEAHRDEKYLSKYLDESNFALFPFGYGLSYTEFRYSNLTLSTTEISLRNVDEVYDLAGIYDTEDMNEIYDIDNICEKDETLTVSITVANVGTREGDEIVQLYIKDEVAEVARPVLELKKFTKIHLDAAQSQIVTFELGANDFAYHHQDYSFSADAGQFKIFVGSSSVDTLYADFRLV
ncbi:MAG: glycoside hydrolase family 3 C-terminal domain-containing protein [Clostridiales Family XIII bacterium]|jgi:beta-glucosidase|nr:glycoside hydrolase family 3 C-terminal domain-containing protein [Clostridiales Family XIII bacterium]